MKYNPADFGLEENFVHWDGDPAEDRMGPFFYRRAEHGVETAMRLEEHHCNGLGVTHGGILMAFADYTLCLAATDDGGHGCLTLSMNSEFLGPSRVGDILTGLGEPTGGGSKIRFSRAQIFANGEAVLNASANVKLLREKR